MIPFTLTLKNYRCFPDSQPLTIEIGPGFTAFTGPNNSGKSSLLKFFFEMRTLFHQLSSHGVENFVANGAVQVGPIKIEDSSEIFHNQNTRPISLAFDLGPLEHELNRVILTTVRDANWNWKADGFLGGADRDILVSRISGDGRLFRKGQERPNFPSGALKEICKALADCYYIGPFRNAISEAQGAYYDLAIGTDFIATWDNWKTGVIRANNEAIQLITEDIAHIFGFKKLEINASPDKKALQVIVNSKPYRLRELGAGLAQFIIVFGNVAIRKPSFLLIDEPELNLHPSLQADFLTSLAAYTTHGVIFATHSVGLARTIADRIYTFQNKGEFAIVKPFDQTPNYAEFLGEMSFSSFKELGFDKLLLVEGVTEVKAVQQFLRLLRKDHEIVVIPLGGSQFIAPGREQELYELTQICGNISVLIDSERTHEGEALSPERTSFVKDCQKLGFKTHTTQRRAFENYLTETAIKRAKDDNYKALGQYNSLKTAEFRVHPESWCLTLFIHKGCT